jgi:hypothetical protein
MLSSKHGQCDNRIHCGCSSIFPRLATRNKKNTGIIAEVPDDDAERAYGLQSCFQRVPVEPISNFGRARARKDSRYHIRAMKLSRSNCLIRIDTNAGISGTKQVPRTHGESQDRSDETISNWEGPWRLKFISQPHDPMHAWMAHIPTISGIDIAVGSR